MRQLIFVFSLTCFLLHGSAVWADGAVSGGGGGTTNPEPAHPEWIVTAVHQYAGPVLLAWLHQEEARFLDLDSIGQEQSKFSLLFRGPKTIFQVLEETQVELRMTSPCLDAQGRPHDGSIYAQRPGAICLSPFTMAPKLNAYDVTDETLALIIHELSHLLGASEEEATFFQTRALWSLRKVDYLDFQIELDLLIGGGGSAFFQLLSDIEYFQSLPQKITKGAMEVWEEKLLNFQDKLSGRFWRKLEALRSPLAKLYGPHFMKASILKTFVCSRDTTLDPEIKKGCEQELSKGFQEDSEVSTKLYSIRTTHLEPELIEEEYEKVKVRRLEGTEDLVEELESIKVYLMQVYEQISQLKNFQVPLYRM